MINDMGIRRKDGSSGTARSMKIAAGGELDGVDILTWPPYAPIWPDPGAYSLDDKVEADWLDLGSTSSLFAIQSGLIKIQSLNFVGHPGVSQDYVFSLENGDDWFYFQDKYTGTRKQLMVDSAPPAIEISTVSGVETEVLRLRFPKRPGYKVLHKGGCSFTGIRTPAESSLGKSSRVHNRLKKQQNGNTGL